jgi:transcriptional regulator with XRE-family HTH domain
VTGFAELLARYRAEARLTQRGLAHAAGVNPAVINRLEHGDRPPSGPEQVLMLARALALSPSRRDALLASAGHWPLALLTLGPQDQSLQAVARVLTDDRVSPASKDRFRQVLATLTDQWLPDPDGQAAGAAGPVAARGGGNGSAG